MSAALHLNLDDAWAPETAGLPVLDLREWGPRLRFAAPGKLIEKFYSEHSARLSPFLLYGSGDFHHLSALWLRRLSEPFVLISFDNHPDWDVRPPRWACGGWINRALEQPQLRKAIVWGCGNFETWWPARIFGNRRAEEEGRLELHAWADERGPRERARPGAILRTTWREEFERSMTSLAGENIYLTIDLDCLRAGEAVTNWENGRFSVEDVVWALGKLRGRAHVIAGDICGAYSKPVYARRGQRFVAEFDHPKLTLPNELKARAINSAALAALWPALTQGNKDDAGRDQERADN
ncbi:MAG: hypothetical protein M3Y86_01870 [Verrucomicrobiota bacterium]|nr:hypothetical protein [Verrucomicrobiota bacterium]